MSSAFLQTAWLGEDTLKVNICYNRSVWQEMNDHDIVL